MFLHLDVRVPGVPRVLAFLLRHVYVPLSLVEEWLVCGLAIWAACRRWLSRRTVRGLRLSCLPRLSPWLGVQWVEALREASPLTLVEISAPQVRVRVRVSHPWRRERREAR